MRPTLLSPDRVSRRDQWRRAVKRAAADRHIDEAVIGRRLGYTPSRWTALMTFGALPSMSAADVPLLCDVMGTDEPLEVLARSRGYRLVREVEAPASQRDLLGAVGAAVARVGELASATVAALPDGLNSLEASHLQREIERARRALAELEGQVASHAAPVRVGR